MNMQMQGNEQDGEHKTKFVKRLFSSSKHPE